MAEAQPVVKYKATSSTPDSCDNSDTVHCDTETVDETINTQSPVASQLIRSSSNILNRIKTITFGRLRKQCPPSSPKSVSPTTAESTVALDDLQSSADSTVITSRGEEKASHSSKNGRRRKILSHLCTSASTESESESSIDSIASNPPLETSERSSPPSSSSTNPISRPSYPSNLLTAGKVNETFEFKATPQSSRPIQSSSSIEPNNMNGHQHNVSQSVSSAVVIRSPELTVSTRRAFDESVLPYPYLNRLNEATVSTVPKPLSPAPVAPVTSKIANRALPYRVHTQIDFVHCFVPDFLEITNFPFYWCKMDQYEADKLLENKPHGTFLLRDSAQEGHLFSVSFRRFQMSAHARIEQSNDKVTFNTLDPGVYSSPTVRGLIEHYRDPKNWMFFEPMLIYPLNRPFPFSLKHLSRATICSLTTYDSVSQLPLPKPLKHYLQEYHFKKKVAERRFDPNTS